MFSEYASRFLAQSQSRLSLSQNDPQPTRNPLDRRRDANLRAPSRGYLQRRPLGNPYQPTAGSQTSRFPFASRTLNTQAPLFYSATDDFREEDDAAEHEREAADLYALQQSRRDYGTSHISESSEEDDRIGTSRAQSGPFGRGIKSSWTGDEEDARDASPEAKRGAAKVSQTQSVASSVQGRARDKLVDVELASTIHEADEEEPSMIEDESPPSLQQFRKPMRNHLPQDSRMLQSETAPFLSGQRSSSSDRESVPPTASAESATGPQNFDTFWSSLFVIDMIAMLSTFFLVLLHTASLSKNSPFGDTIYNTLRSSFFLLGIDTLVAVVVALVWIAALRSFVRPLIYLILITVPIIAISFTIYPFVSSFKGTWHGKSIQDKVMRLLAWVPALFAIVWSYTAYRGRHSLDRAISLLQFTTRILAACPTLVLVGFTTLAIVVIWTWIWMLMFTRVFLNGHVSTTGKTMFIINPGTWWLGGFFVLSYLWSLGVISGLQRATTAAATSQWYFYRNAAPAPSPKSVVRAAIIHATTKIFGTICLSTLLALAVRLPLLVLPARLSSYVTLFFYSFVPTSIATITNPLSLTYAAIHSQPLTLSARGLTELTFVAPAAGTGPTAALTPHAFSKPHPNNRGTPNLFAYRLAKLLLHATRFATSLAFGFGGWVSTARTTTIEGSTMRGSMYAYIVGLIAGAIGWAVLGAVEGVLGGVLDAVVICWGSDVQSGGNGQARFCREAGELLENDGTTISL